MFLTHEIRVCISAFAVEVPQERVRSYFGQSLRLQIPPRTYDDDDDAALNDVS